MICLNSSNILVFISGMLVSLVLGMGVTLAVLTIIANRVNGLEEDLESFEGELQPGGVCQSR